MVKVNQTIQELIKQINEYRNANVKILMLTLACLFIGLFFNVSLITALAVILVSYIAGRNVSGQFGKSLLSTTIYGFVCLVLYISAFSTLLWLINIAVPLRLLVLISALISISSTILLSKPIDKKSPLIDIFDVISLCVIGVYIALIGIGIYRSNGYADGVLVAVQQTSAFGIDDLSHNNMFKDTLEANRGLLLGSGDADYISKTDNISYPKMSHTTGAALASLFYLPDKFNTEDYFTLYTYTKAIFFIIALYVLCRSALLVTKINKHKLIFGLGAFGPLALMTVLFVNSFFQEGFYSVWPILVTTPLLILGLTSQRHTLLKYNLMFALIFVIITMSWPLYGLPIGAVLSYLFLKDLIQNKKNLKAFLRMHVPTIAIAPLGLIQLYVQIFDRSAPIDSSQINATGGIVGFPFMVAALISIILLVSFYTNKKLKSATGLWVLMGAILFILIGIGMSNIEKTGTVQYFFIKTAYIYLILAMMVAVGFIANLSVVLFKKTKDKSALTALAAVMIVTVTVVGAAFMLYAEHGYIKYAGGYLISGRRNVSPSALKAQLDGSTPEIVVSLDSKLETYYLSTVSRSLNRFDYCMGDIYTYLNSEQSSDLRNCINKSYELTVIDNANYANQIDSQKIPALLTNLNEKNVTINTDFVK